MANVSRASKLKGARIVTATPIKSKVDSRFISIDTPKETELEQARLVTSTSVKSTVVMKENQQEQMEPSTLEMWITNTNPGLTALPSKILGYLDVKSIANCRVLSSTFRVATIENYYVYNCIVVALFFTHQTARSFSLCPLRP